MDIFVNQEKINSHSVFSPFWKENILVGLGRKYLGPIIYFLSSPPNQTHSKKVFLSIFSPKFSIHHISPPNKHKGKKRNYRSSQTFSFSISVSVSVSVSVILSFRFLFVYYRQSFSNFVFFFSFSNLFKSLYFSNPQVKL